MVLADLLKNKIKEMMRPIAKKMMLSLVPMKMYCDDQNFNKDTFVQACGVIYDILDEPGIMEELKKFEAIQAIDELITYAASEDDS